MGVRGRTVLLLLGAALVLWAVLQTAGILLGDRVSNQIDQRTAQAGASRAVSQIEESAQQLTLVTAD